MKVLITGITGFKGSHLAEHLLQQGIGVCGIVRWRSKMDNIAHLVKDIQLINGDVRDAYSVRKSVEDAQPDYLVHLAAQSWVAESWRSPHEALYTNVMGTLNVLEAVRLAKPDCTVVIAGSSEEYGKVEDSEVPITEDNPLRPLSPYGVSKVAADLLGRQYFRSYGLRIVVTRAFNTTGPRRGEVFITSFYAKRLAAISAGKMEPRLPLGNMTTLRDFTDVRDTVRAYWLVATKGIPGEVYNICSGVARSGLEVLDTLIRVSGVEAETYADPALMRPSDVPILLGNCSKLSALTGWSPTISFEQTMSDLLSYWKDNV